MFELEAEALKWRNHLASTRTLSYSDLEELESRLRDSIKGLEEQGIGQEEAFLLAAKRLGNVPHIKERFAKVPLEDMWRPLFVPTDTPLSTRRNRKEIAVVLLLSLCAGLMSKIPLLLGYGDIDANEMLYMRIVPVFIFFPLALYFIWKRSLPLPRSFLVLGVFPVYLLISNLYPSIEPHHTSLLSIIHAPILGVYLLFYFYGGPDIVSSNERVGWRNPNTRLEFIRFLGELFIFTVLIGLGGMVLIALTLGTFSLVGIDLSGFVASWIAPLGFFGIFPVAAYLVGQKKSHIESIAPILAKIFTPLFLVVLISLVIAFLSSTHTAYENRMMLIWFDIILALVLALALYSMSAKDYQKNGVQTARYTVWDILTLALIIAAVAVDLIALSGIITRLSAYGFTANKAAALGENVILLVNLLLLMSQYLRYCMGKQRFQKIVEMQMRFLDVYAIWAVVVIVVFPLIFGFR